MSSQDAPTPGRSPSIRRRWIIAASIAVLAAVVVIGGIAWYLNQDAPAEVSLASAVEDLESTTTAAATPTTSAVATTATTEPAGPPGVDGTWHVDTTVGTFSFEDATSSFVGFRIEEVLGTIGATTAVGRTPLVAGRLTISGTSVTEAVVEADMTGIVTNNSRRDGAVQRALGTDSLPISTFELLEPIDLGAIPEDGEPIAVEATGELTIKGVTQPIAIPLEAQIVDDLIVVVGSVDIIFADWDVEVPTARIVVSAEDHGILEFQLFFARP